MKRFILKNWRAKLISLLLATTLWYLIALTPDTPIVADPAEFDGSAWFLRREVADWAAGRTDPHLHRFLTKVQQLTGATGPRAATQ